jgi:glycosyltransferase involved in cell wall biosynthesis
MTPHRASAGSSTTIIPSDITLVVHSHLRWDFVWQRPQQLLSRIALANPVVFVEEPVRREDIADARLSVTTPHSGVTRVVPELPASLDCTYDELVAVVRDLLASLLASRRKAACYQRIVQWFYTPMPAPVMLDAFNEVAVVYDCMDELAQFRFAPTDIADRERQLLSRASVVFTGGYRLFESKSRHHDNVHFFGCGVDVAHFGKARLAETRVPSDIARVAHPVLGYFGVIDERLDYDLIRAIAAARPEWSLLMIGPVVKVDPRELPTAANIHWLGQRSYEDLPRYLKAFDVCLMPFALNDATEYINPTKTLEYLASGKPVVSTAVADVVRNFKPIVRIARSTEEFIGAVSAAIEAPDPALRAAGIRRASAASWTSIVERMRELIGETLGGETLERAPQPAPSENANVARSVAWRLRGRAAGSLDLAPEAGGAAP